MVCAYLSVVTQSSMVELGMGICLAAAVIRHVEPALVMHLVYRTWCWNAGKYTVPVLWDKKKKTIVNNESADIVRMLNDRMNKLAKNVSLNRQTPRSPAVCESARSSPCCAVDFACGNMR